MRERVAHIRFFPQERMAGILAIAYLFFSLSVGHQLDSAAEARQFSPLQNPSKLAYSPPKFAHFAVGTLSFLHSRSRLLGSSASGSATRWQFGFSLTGKLLRRRGARTTTRNSIQLRRNAQRLNFHFLVSFYITHTTFRRSQRIA